MANPDMDKSQPPLRWMSYEATAAGLRMAPFKSKWDLKPTVNIHESLSGVWHLFEWLPWGRLTYRDCHTMTHRYA